MGSWKTIRLPKLGQSGFFFQGRTNFKLPGEVAHVDVPDIGDDI